MSNSRHTDRSYLELKLLALAVQEALQNGNLDLLDGALDRANSFLQPYTSSTTCINCGRQVELFPGIRRSDTRTCGATCRTSVYRKRKRAGLVQ
jgi:hypothetical protein